MYSSVSAFIKDVVIDSIEERRDDLQQGSVVANALFIRVISLRDMMTRV